MLKVDFQKAFDSISWDYLLSVLECMNFPRKWIVWISSMLSSSRISPLVNGSAVSPFSIGRGVRQGDPLSPY